MTPYELVGSGCDQALGANSRFVQAVIVNNVTGELLVYNPLIITQGAALLAHPAPINFTLGDHVVGLWFGSNSNYLTLTNDLGISNGRCNTGPQGSPFGQSGWCNADRFWMTVNLLIQRGNITVPQLGKAADGLPCPTLRDFFIVDMSPEDGVTTSYLVTNLNQVIQNTQNNQKMFSIKSELTNVGNNRLLTDFVNPAIGCDTILIPDGADPGVKRSSIVMNVIQAMLRQGTPIALVPFNDPIVLTNGQPDLMKMNLYRAGVDEPQAGAFGGDNDPTTYCTNYANIAIPRFKSLGTVLKNSKPPTPGFNTLFDFMRNRSMTTWDRLTCQQLTGQINPFSALI